ncbi:hypothetical protein FGO68_gene9094 [Halteria grandinella]|uniref:Uncharacterized protein n=1 Tax=Halteria grandinella TaxID=5974 RepID=A0A8J8NX79_HALGN|nr:hypothetical protein FGO68_gene9094 [Halteria grandinella]
MLAFRAMDFCHYLYDLFLCQVFDLFFFIDLGLIINWSGSAYSVQIYWLIVQVRYNLRCLNLLRYIVLLIERFHFVKGLTLTHSFESSSNILQNIFAFLFILLITSSSIQLFQDRKQLSQCLKFFTVFSTSGHFYLTSFFFGRMAGYAFYSSISSLITSSTHVNSLSLLSAFLTSLQIPSNSFQTRTPRGSGIDRMVIICGGPYPLSI